MDCRVHGLLQARILEWVAFPFSRESSQPRDRIFAGLPHCRRILYLLNHKGSPRILEWAAARRAAVPSRAALPDPGIKPGFPALQADSLPTNLSERLITPIRWLLLKAQKISTGKQMEKLEPLYTVGGSVKQCSHYWNRKLILQKLKMELTHALAVSLLNIVPKWPKAGIWTSICIPMFIETLFTVTKRDSKQLKYSPTDEWVNKLLYIIQRDNIQP